MESNLIIGLKYGAFVMSTIGKQGLNIAQHIGQVTERYSF